MLPGEGAHVRCRAEFRRLRPAMVTTWPAFAEAMVLAARDGGWPAQERLWRLVVEQALTLASVAEPLRVAELMAKYRDVPMDLADATLIALAEQDGHRRIFTIDSDFHIYRLGNGRLLDVVPRR